MYCGTPIPYTQCQWERRQIQKKWLNTKLNYVNHTVLNYRTIVSDELESMSEEGTWPVPRYHASIYEEGLRKGTKSVRTDTLRWDLNSRPNKYKAGELITQKRHSVLGYVRKIRVKTKAITCTVVDFDLICNINICHSIMKLSSML